jgi:cell wall-associated NlpC family hydrolase
MCRRLLLSVCVLVALTVSPSAAAKPASSWAQAELDAVVAAGLMAREAAARPNKPLTKGELELLVAGLLRAEPVKAAAPTATVTIAGLDARLVNALGLTDAARVFNASAKTSGLSPPSRFGTESVARLLSLRKNHPAGRDHLELRPAEPATRAEAAYSAAQILRFGRWNSQPVNDLATTFVLPALTAWQKRILSTSVRFIGYPYVWAGQSESSGFDCSGFVWRVYKVQAYPGAARLAETLQGRTTYTMSGEEQRIPLAKLQPADVIFFGAKGPRSKPAQVDHMGIYLGNGWFIHSSRHGVAIAPVSGGYEKRLAWGRRPLAEAGLISAS